MFCCAVVGLVAVLLLVAVAVSFVAVVLLVAVSC